MAEGPTRSGAVRHQLMMKITEGLAKRANSQGRVDAGCSTLFLKRTNIGHESLNVCVG
jgi:hypothetical protein